MIAAILLMAAAPAEPIDCDEGSTQIELNLCARGAFESTDAELNTYWKRIAAAMKAKDGEIDRATDKEPGYFDTLLAGQRAWLVYRDKQCLLESFELRGGSGAPGEYSGCMERVTRQRLNQLKSVMGEAGD
jgi:uncharacterized protein YecT (DUF1311 family)